MNQSISKAQAVRGAVKVNGTLIQGWTEFEVNNSSYSSADTFNCTFAANALTDDRNARWFSEQKDMFVELFVGFPPDRNRFTADELPSWIYGHVDKVSYDPENAVINVSGRDLTRLFIDNKTTEKFQNKTASQIATMLALRRGLTANVAATTTPVGKYYEIDHEFMHDAKTEWDLLNHLARVEQYVVRVRGKILFFQPKTDPATTKPYEIKWTPPNATTGYPTCNVTGLKLDRALTVSRGIIVTVRSFNDAAQKVFTATYPVSKPKATTPGQSAPTGNAQNYFYNVANLTQEKVLQFAKAKHAEIIQHEMLACFDIPGNSELDVMSVIRLNGTGTAWDQNYFPDSLKRSLSIDDGYRLKVDSKNHAPDSQETGA
ncbi:hypothetical protein PQQ53_21365 [Paraburkholderia strydomiana]|uniref:hypothetical protein n=1 Tax=Paraburkholderia strydomiana TaxID=1245417 RepID=UPI0038B91868